MLDVHPPEHTPHTWRDFFIHIATIVLGLVIAIGLEQSVVAFQHHQERRELETELRGEAQRNLDLVQRNLGVLQARQNFVNANIVALGAAPASNGRISASALKPPPPHLFDLAVIDPSQAVWSVAKANGSVALLPAAEAQVYARLDHEGDILQLGENDLGHAADTLRSFHSGIVSSSHGPLQYLTLAQRDETVRDLSAVFTQGQDTITLELNEAGACRGVLNGATSVDEMIQYMVHEGARYEAQQRQKH